MIRSLLLILILSVITSGCSREESSTKDELILGLIIGYAVNYSNPCKDGRPVLEVSQGQVKGPFNSPQCFHLSNMSDITITMFTNSNYKGDLTIWKPERVASLYADNPSLYLSGLKADVWVSAVCGNSNCYPYSVQF